LPDLVYLRRFIRPLAAPDVALGAAGTMVVRLAPVENQLPGLTATSQVPRRRPEPVGDSAGRAVPHPGSALPPKKDKNHRQGIAGGFGGLS